MDHPALASSAALASANYNTPAEMGFPRDHFIPAKDSSGSAGYAVVPDTARYVQPFPHNDPASAPYMPDQYGDQNIRRATPSNLPGQALRQEGAADPGSVNLHAPNYASGRSNGDYDAGRPNNQRSILPGGPVTAHTLSEWSGKRTPIVRGHVGQHGPVKGGDPFRDTAQTVQQAQYAALAAYYSQQASDIAVVSAI